MSKVYSLLMDIRKPRWYLTILAGALVLSGLYFSSLYNYLLFHSIAEIFSIIVAFGIFIIAWNSRRFLDNNYFIFIGISYLFVGHVDLAHTFAYPGMGIFQGYGTNTAAQLWISARYIESLALLIAPLIIGRKLKVNLLFLVYGLTISIGAVSIFYWQNFPVCFVEGVGLTTFKKTSEYVISAILLGSIFTLYRKRGDFDSNVLRLLVVSIILTVASELFFTLYVHAYGLPNLIGHFLKIVSFYLIYKAIIETGLVRPYDLLFRSLKRSEERFRDLYEEAPNAYLSVSTDSRIERANRSAIELLGYSLNQLVGRPVLDIYADTPNGKAKAQELFQRFLTGEEIRDEELEICRADGSNAWINLSVRPILDEKGRVVASRSELVDITEHKKLDQLKDEFISLVSHEMRSPLTVITGAVNTVLTEGARLSQEETRQLLKDAALETESLSHLLGNLLELSRIQANRLSLHAEAMSVRKVVQGTVEEVKRQSSRHEFVVDLPKELPPVYADELRLERILYNLLENAVKYSPQGGEIRVSVTPTDKHLVIGVSDQGIGISSSDQDKLFGPFQRLEESRPEGAGGLGLGLLVCRRLVEAHGGQIWVESEPGQGSTFFFTVPLSHS